MFTFRIEGIVGARIFLSRPDITKAVSLVAPTLENWESRGPHHLVIRTVDTSNPKKHAAPTPDTLNEILDFTHDLKDSDHFLIHCHMGVSRSTATMIGILIQHGMSAEEAFQTVKISRPVLRPNPLITNFVDERFNLGGKLIEIVEKHNTEVKSQNHATDMAALMKLL